VTFQNTAKGREVDHAMPKIHLNEALQRLQRDGSPVDMKLGRSESNREVAYAPLFETAR
jgi:hypothetical protein